MSQEHLLGIYREGSVLEDAKLVDSILNDLGQGSQQAPQEAGPQGDDLRRVQTAGTVSATTSPATTSPATTSYATTSDATRLNATRLNASSGFF